MTSLVQYIDKYTNTRVKLETKRIPDHITILENII